MKLEVEICLEASSSVGIGKNDIARKATSLGGTVREVLDLWERLERRSLGLSIIQAIVGNHLYLMVPGTGLSIAMDGVGIRLPSPEERAAFETALQLGQVQIAVIHHMTQSHLILHQATGIPLAGMDGFSSERS
ncbi:hypothetical protein BLL42_27380 (plasmid) [Pseudomonas frederiksbergensis]|uniref:Uncharacterized protein n=1 Tax=Pseudomonas frederiksbergensis TaxID=104087 RepID=A0A1J0EUJ3_9PSED|nr:hypothetical protein BLL42_27380 [Pseudomonas frederiksbergensis]